MEVRFKKLTIFLIFAISIPIFLAERKNIEFRHLEKTSKISIKVNGVGEQNILNKSFKNRPNQILIDGKEVEFTDSKVNIEKENSEIELIWNEPLTDCHVMFLDASNIIEMNFKDFDTSQVTDMSNMFESCTSIQSLDLTSFKTSKVTNMSGMFKKCHSLKILNISNFDTSNVSDMSYMFDRCRKLKDLEISYFNTEKVTNMAGMFQSCVKAKIIDVKNFDTSSVTNMEIMFHSCTSLESLDLSKFKTSKVKTMFGMFASLSLNYLNLSSFDISDTSDISYLFYDSNILLLDLSNFLAKSLNLYDNTFEYTPILKYINLRNYQGSDIFKSVSSNKLTICRDESLSEKEAILEDKNFKNNCSDVCFYEFIKIKEDKEGCEVDCNKIEDKNNQYYYICNPKIDSTTFNLISTQILTTIPKITTIIETNSTISTIPGTTAITANNSTNNESSESTTVTESTESLESSESTTVIESTESSETLESSESTTATESTESSETFETDTITNALNTTDSKLKIMLYGYQNFRYISNIISFRIYFIVFDGFVPKNIYFTLFIIFSNYVRYLDETNGTATCTLNEEENDKLYQYNCEAKPKQEVNLKNITVNYDFDFQTPYELTISPQAEINKDKLIEQTGDMINSKHFIYLKGILTQDSKYFSIKGELDQNYAIDKQFNLTVYDAQNSNKNISCETINEKYDNIEIKCNKTNLNNIRINNTVSYMTSSQMLVMITEGQNDLISQISQPNETNYEQQQKHFYKSKSKSNSTAIIIVIIVIFVVVIALIIGGIILYRKRILQSEKPRLPSDSSFNFHVSSSGVK